VCRTANRGLPELVIQEEKKTPTEQEKVRGNIKGAKLIGDTNFKDLIAISFYHTKPVNFMSMACESVQLIKKEQKVFDKSKGKLVKQTFLRLNINDQYNCKMGDADISDQLWLLYRVDRWMRKFKWWHSLFWWGVQKLMTDSYVMYKRFNSELNMKKNSHYNFHKVIMNKHLQSRSLDLLQPLDSLSTESSLTSTTTNSTSSVKRKRLNDINLHPLTGNLRMQLDHTTCKHWSSTCMRKEDYCQLHYWAFKGSTNRSRIYKNSIYCNECRVTLCLGYCYKAFHEIWDLARGTIAYKTI